jgi:hypothetical protein
VDHKAVKIRVLSKRKNPARQLLLSLPLLLCGGKDAKSEPPYFSSHIPGQVTPLISLAIACPNFKKGVKI